MMGRLPPCTMISKPLLDHLCLLYCVLTAGAAVKVIVNTPSIQVTRGGNVLLPCSYRTTAALNRLNIIWTVSPLLRPQQPLQVISYEQGQIVESLSDYLGRVTFAFPPTLDASIILNHSRVSDTGTYQCTVINPPDGATPNIGLVGLTVLVPPSAPDCSSDGHGQEGGSVRLRCSVREGTPTPRIRWEKIPPSAQRLISTQEDYHGSITLTNLTSETSGLYRCTATNQLGAQTCAVELHIRVGGLGSMGIFAAITITLIMGLVLLALFILVLCLHQQSRGKWQEQAYSVDNLSPGQCHETRGPCSECTMSSRGPTHILYSVRQSHPTLEVSTITKQRSQALLSPTLEVSTIGKQRSQALLSPISKQRSQALLSPTLEVPTITKQRSQALLSPTLEVSTIGKQRSQALLSPISKQRSQALLSPITKQRSQALLSPTPEVSTTTSEESSTGTEEEEMSPARCSSIYSVHSGYLV